MISGGLAFVSQVRYNKCVCEKGKDGVGCALTSPVKKPQYHNNPTIRATHTHTHSKVENSFSLPSKDRDEFSRIQSVPRGISHAVITYFLQVTDLQHMGFEPSNIYISSHPSWNLQGILSGLTGM